MTARVNKVTKTYWYWKNRTGKILYLQTPGPGWNGCSYTGLAELECQSVACSAGINIHCKYSWVRFRISGEPSVIPKAQYSKKNQSIQPLDHKTFESTWTATTPANYFWYRTNKYCKPPVAGACKQSCARQLFMDVLALGLMTQLVRPERCQTTIMMGTGAGTILNWRLWVRIWVPAKIFAYKISVECNTQHICTIHSK